MPGTGLGKMLNANAQIMDGGKGKHWRVLGYLVITLGTTVASLRAHQPEPMGTARLWLGTLQYLYIIPSGLRHACPTLLLTNILVV